MEEKEEVGAICYIVQATKESPVYLCVMDRDRQQFHTFPVTVANLSRLTYECSAIVNAAISGYSDKHAYSEIAQVLSQRFADKASEG